MISWVSGYFGNYGGAVWLGDRKRFAKIERTDGVDVYASLSVPATAEDTARIAAVVAEQPEEMWHRYETDPDIEDTWWTCWQVGEGAAVRADRDAVIASVFSVLRAGYGVEYPSVVGWAEIVPMPGDPELTTCSPSRSGAPANCTGWDDFERRLGWVLQTLPEDWAVNLEVSGAQRRYQQIWRSRDVLYASVFDATAIGSTSADHDREMAGLGWTHREIHWWKGVATVADAGNLSGRIVRTFREVFAIDGPEALAHRGFRSMPNADVLDYLDAELGLPRSTVLTRP
ncbi:hypothetical protein ACFVUS_05830 [Nocardia sp. NPDC058058]|uniref:TY-Chap domain-containing protein n=1 Tax=Nocardia sp. NPDC058058 TaxID=3346317 RepID=UPI0036DEA686